MSRQGAIGAIFLAGIATACVAMPAAADVTVVMVRHGEKPELGLGQLNCQGLNRALALPDVLAAKFGKPDALFAPDPGVMTDDFGKRYNYIRPLATIEPTAIRFGLPVNTAWGLANIVPLEDELLGSTHAGQVVFVAWEHNLVVKIVREIFTRRGADPKSVPDWSRDDFDSIYVLTIPTAGKPSLRIDHEGLDGQSTACPDAVPATRPASSAAPLPRKALVGIAPIEAASRDEVALNRRADCLPSPGVPWFARLEGDTPILVTAPHVTQPFREGAYRFADGGGTGALALALGRMTGAAVIYTVDASPSDPNFYDDNDFKAAVAQQIGEKHPRLLLDIHASHSDRPYDVDLGTMDGASLLGQTDKLRELVDALHGEGIANVSLDYFSAKEHQTLTKYASTRGVPAIQLEINSTWLHPSASELGAHRFSQLLQALARYAEQVRPGSLTKPASIVPLDLDSRSCTNRVPAT